MTQVLKQALHLSLKQQLQLVMEHSFLLEMPITAIDRALEKIVEDPGIVASAMAPDTRSGAAPRRQKCTVLGHSYQALFSHVLGNDAPQPSPLAYWGRAGFVLPPLAVIASQEQLAKPDVTYEVREHGSFTLVTADHFKPVAPSLRLEQIPSSTQPFLRWLVKERNWMVQTLQEVYHAIGKQQASFIFMLDPASLTPLPIERLPARAGLPYHPTTYFRLCKQRTVAITSSYGHTVVLPMRYLLPRQVDVFAYHHIPQINALLVHEAATGSAMSAYQMHRTLAGSIAARTIRKYFSCAEIPSSYARQRAYDSGRKEPYRMAAAIDAYIQRKEHAS